MMSSMLSDTVNPLFSSKLVGEKPRKYKKKSHDKSVEKPVYTTCKYQFDNLVIKGVYTIVFMQ